MSTHMNVHGRVRAEKPEPIRFERTKVIIIEKTYKIAPDPVWNKQFWMMVNRNCLKCWKMGKHYKHANDCHSWLCDRYISPDDEIEDIDQFIPTPENYIVYDYEYIPQPVRINGIMITKME